MMLPLGMVKKKDRQVSVFGYYILLIWQFVERQGPPWMLYGQIK